MQSTVERRKLLQAGGVFVFGLLAGCGLISNSSETTNDERYIVARVVDERPANDEIIEYSDERVQACEYTRELVPKAVNGGEYAETRIPEGEENPCSGLPTSYIAYEEEVVRMLIRTLD